MNETTRGVRPLSLLDWRFVILVATTVLSAPVATTIAQVAGGASGGGGGRYSDNGKKVQFAAIPVPNYNPNFGWGIGALVTGFYKIDRGDTLCPPSSTGLFGFWSENKSTIYGIWQQIYLDEDKWRGTLVFVRPDINFQFQVDPDLPVLGGNWINYTTDNSVFLIKASRETWSNVYFGIQYRYRESTLSFDLAIDIPPEWLGRAAKFSGLGPIGSYDTRDNIFNATAGWLVEFESTFNRSLLGSDFDYEKWSISVIQYIDLLPHRVLAWQVLSAFGSGDVPFDDEEIFGVRGLRGYADGKYRGKSQAFGQAEYRWNFWGRWGAVGFAGAGWAFDEISQISTDTILPAVGFGARFMMIKSYRINVGMDVAWGKDDTVFYFRIGEAF
jgi:hypothetical protein